MDAVFTNCSEEEDIYPLTTVEIADAQRASHFRDEQFCGITTICSILNTLASKRQ